MTRLHPTALIFLLAVPCSHFAAQGKDDIHWCVRQGDLDKVKALLAKNPKLVNSQDEYRNTPLQIAAQGDRKAIAEVLLAAGAKLDFESAAAFGMTKEIAAMLKEKPALAKAQDSSLYFAAGRHHLDVVKLLLDHGANPNRESRVGNVSGPISPLSGAIGSGDFEIAKLLCERGAKLKVGVGKNSPMAFHYCVAYRDPRFIQLMLKHKADPDARDDWWDLAPLHITASQGAIKKAIVLLDFKADINTHAGWRDAAVFRRRTGPSRLLRVSPEARRTSGCLFGVCARKNGGRSRPPQGPS